MTASLDPRLTFDSFVVGPANSLAVAAARHVAEAPGSAYNPLLVQGGSGLGKTHLLTAIGHEALRRGAGPVVYRGAERLGDEWASAPRGGVLLLDDAQVLGARSEAQEGLIHAWDELLAAGGQLVLASDRPLHEIAGLDERLLSRLAGGLIVHLATPDYTARLEIARRTATARGVSLSPAVHQVLARGAFTNVRELQGAVTRLIAVQELEGRDVGAEEVGDLLGLAPVARRATHWMMSPEKVLWEWPDPQDWLEESLD
jgi:chromosomal replication initiator protein